MVRRTGQGARLWSDIQKAELLAKGRVSGFIGHHINSVAESPLLAGIADNIAFVANRAEHLAAHMGSWANGTFGPLLNR